MSDREVRESGDGSSPGSPEQGYLRLLGGCCLHPLGGRNIPLWRGVGSSRQANETLPSVALALNDSFVEARVLRIGRTLRGAGSPKG